MPRCLIALGGNVGAVAETFAEALRRLDELPPVRLEAGSGVYRSRPVGEQVGGEFRNAAALLETDLDALELLDHLQQLEREAGRVRTARWGPRTLDLDLILYGDARIAHPRLRVPHPACWYRRFVLDPAVEIGAELVHPEKGLSLAALRDRLLPRPLRMALAGADETRRRSLIDLLAGDFPEAAIQHWRPAGGPETEPPALIAWLGPAEPEGEAGVDFRSLDQVARLDASAAGDQASFLRHVLQAALGACHRLR